MNSISISTIKDEVKVIDPNEQQIIKNQITKATSDSELIATLGSQFRNDIIVYSDLQNYKTIQELLPTNKSFKIILIRETENSGHWTCLMRYNKTIEFFNSYGLFPSVDLKYIDQNENNRLGQNNKWLNILLKKAYDDGFTVIYNKKKFQKMSNTIDISTCGLHVCLRLLMLLKYNYTLSQYIKFMDELKKTSRLNYDELVSLIIK